MDRSQKNQQAIGTLSRSRAIRRGDIEEFSREVCLTASEVLEVDRVGIWFFTPQRDELVLKKLYQKGMGEFSEGAILNTHDYPQYFKALEDQRSIVAHNAHEDPATSEFSDAYLKPLGINSMLDCPIRDGVEVKGVICIEHVGDLRKWSLEEINFASVCSDLLSLAVSVELRNQVELELLEKKQKLEESNITLQTVLARIEEEKKNIRQDVALNIEASIQPLIEKMKLQEGGDDQLLEQLESGLQNISSDFYKKLVKVQYNLTPTERRICQLIKNGYSGKEIASLLTLSYSTVETHKKNIRRKLELTNTSVNLRTFLDEIDQL